MMKNLMLFISACLFTFQLSHAQSTIKEARQMPVGSTVTVTGIASHGSVFAPSKRDIQDATAGIVIYDPKVSTVDKGDSITVTGKLSSYQGLLEITSVSSVQVLSTGHTVTPIVISASQIGEAYEGMLVQIHHVVFSDGGNTFVKSTNYSFTSDGVKGQIRTENFDLDGKVIPIGEVTLTAIVSQYTFSDPNTGYQLLPRGYDDIQLSSSYFTAPVTQSAMTKNSFSVSWETNIAGSTEAYYGNSPDNLNNHANANTSGTAHSIELTGLTPGELYWINAFSVAGTDTIQSVPVVFATVSNSTGNMKVYFNNAVDHSVSTGTDAINVGGTLDDSLIAYINRAKYSIDFTMYTFNNTNISDVSTALNDAYNRGVQVRVVKDGSTGDEGWNELNAGIGKIHSPVSSYYGIMHNKFVIIDANSEDPNDPIVWTGSTNMTDGQVNDDANEVIIIQDQSLARSYTLEFNEMFGTTGDQPDPAKAKFGPDKLNNTPHEFIINGDRIESYFSPSDGVNDKIVDEITTADADLSIQTMLITRTFISDAIVNRKEAGVAVNVLTNAEGGNDATVNNDLSAALGVHFVYDDIMGGILHNKYMVVDQSLPASDPVVLTGSHNWSAAAEDRNDENTLIVHDATIANIYYQNFVKRFTDNLGLLSELNGPPVAVNDTLYVGQGQTGSVVVTDNDILEAVVTMEIVDSAKQGYSYIPFSNNMSISYDAASDFEGKDSVEYMITYSADLSKRDTGKLIIFVTPGTAVNSQGLTKLNVYPNPSAGQFNIQLPLKTRQLVRAEIVNMAGNVMYTKNYEAGAGINTFSISADLPAGLYLLKLNTKETGLLIRKISVK